MLEHFQSQTRSKIQSLRSRHYSIHRERHESGEQAKEAKDHTHDCIHAFGALEAQGQDPKQRQTPERSLDDIRIDDREGDMQLELSQLQELRSQLDQDGLHLMLQSHAQLLPCIVVRVVRKHPRVGIVGVGQLEVESADVATDPPAHIQTDVGVTSRYRRFSAPLRSSHE